MSTYVIIVAGGKGSRMNAVQPKQFLPLKGKAILQHTLEAFHKVDPTFRYIVVLPAQHMEYWNNYCNIKKFSIPHTVIAGGEERFHSVRNAVESITGKGIVLIHDGVRPLVSKQTIKRVIETTTKEGNAVPVLPAVESLRKNEHGKSLAVDRKNMFNVQTPQGFSVDLIKEAYRLPFDNSVTDDATLVERCGIKINTVEGNRENIKITDGFDLKLAEFFLEAGN